MSDEQTDHLREDSEVPPQNSAELLDEVALIEAQPLEERAAGFRGVYERLLKQLQRSDRSDQ